VRGLVDVPTRYLNAPRIALTWGGGFTLRDPLPPVELAVFGQFHVLLPTSHDTVDGSGAVSPLGRASGHVLAGGATVGVRF
jgi:hypothetical protein